MVLRVHGGVGNNQFLTGDLRHYSVIGADFSSAISDGTFVIPNGGGPSIDLVVAEGAPVPQSAAALILKEIEKKATVVISNPTSTALYFALENGDNGWNDVAEIQTMIRTLGTVGVDGVDVSSVTVTGTNYLLGNGYNITPTSILAMTDTDSVAVPEGYLKWNASGTSVEYVTASGGTAASTTVDVSGFTGNLGSGDTNVQLALSTLDSLPIGTRPSDIIASATFTLSTVNSTVMITRDGAVVTLPTYAGLSVGDNIMFLKTADISFDLIASSGENILLERGQLISSLTNDRSKLMVMVYDGTQWSLMI